MRHFSIKITQGGRFIEYSAIARSSGEAMADAFALLDDGEPVAMMVSSQEMRHA